MTIALLCIIFILTAAIVVLIGCVMVARDAETAAKLDEERLRKWLLGSIHCIRAECAHVSPQAISVINSLETALPIHAVVDFIGLRHNLDELRQQDYARAIENARQWDKRIEAERTLGAELPLAGGGS